MPFDFGTICPNELFTMLAIALISTIPGFFRFRNFRGFGFHLTILIEGVYLLTLCILEDTASICGVLFLFAFMLYAVFEMVSDYFGTKIGITDAELEEERTPFWKSLLAWPLLSVLYTLLFTPFLYRALRGGLAQRIEQFPIEDVGTLSVTIYSYTLMTCTLAAWILFLIIWKQSSSDQKNKPTGKFRMTGLRRVVRYPKELATILLFFVIFFSHFYIALYYAPELFILPAVSHLAMIILQIVEVGKKEKADDLLYGDDEEYRQFVTYTPVLLPLIPWNSFHKKHPWEE